MKQPIARPGDIVVHSPSAAGMARSRPIYASNAWRIRAPSQRPTAPKGRKGFGWSVPAPSLDGAYAFVLFAAMLFVKEAGTLSGVVMSVLPLFYLAARHRRFAEVLSSRWPLLIIPAFALLSTLWSEAPGLTAKQGGEMALTVLAGISLAVAVKPGAVLKAMCLAFLIYVAVAIRFGGTGTDGSGEAVFLGLTGGKNQAADLACTGAMVSFAVVFMSLRARSLTWVLISTLCLLLSAYMCLQARSAGATLATGAAIFAFVAMAAIASTPLVVRMGAVTLLAVGAGIVTAVMRNWGSMLIGFASQLFDKDPTLTGRTYLWYRARDLIAEKPWLGRGFDAFWRHGNTDAEGLWQYAGISDRGGFNFHNTLIELTIQVGYIGAAIFCLVLLVAAVGLLRRFVRQPSLLVCFWMAYALYALVRAPTESIGIGPFYYATVLLFAAAANGLEPAAPRVRAGSRYQPQIVRLQVRRAHRAWRPQPGAVPVAAKT